MDRGSASAPQPAAAASRRHQPLLEPGAYHLSPAPMFKKPMRDKAEPSEVPSRRKRAARWSRRVAATGAG